jgi:hypothetical protein
MLNKNRGQLFTSRWQTGLAPVANSGMSATVQIYDPALGASVYDPDTNSYTSVPVTVYSGPARVQPLRSPQAVANNGDDTMVRTVRVQIPVSEVTLAINFQNKLRLTVTESVLNPSLCNYLYVLSGSVDSSNPFERTLEFKVDEEATNG